MAIPTSLGLFQSVAIVLGAICFFLILRERNDDEAWNKCAPTLNVNHCPYQNPEASYECRAARRQMDSYIRSHIQVEFRRNAPEQAYTIYLVASIVLASILTIVLYIFTPLSGQLCLGKIINIVSIGCYALATYWGINITLEYDKKVKTPYKEKVCSLWSTLPIHDFGNPILKDCFRDFHMCQNAILQYVGLGFGILAACFHFLAFFSALWECQTQIDVSDWGTVENLPEENIIQRPDPPVYEIQDEKLKNKREQYQKTQEKELRKKVQEIEKKRQRNEKLVKAKEKLRKKEHTKQELARKKLRQEEGERKMKAERAKKKLERKRKKDEQHKREQELEKKLGAEVNE